ncbi:hypothetical protein [Actinoplanes ianthinogenes]|uniref:hypothetical protein n=1 Tax=Actinoplanes ianthinogenes TaxID=122358 RepID=UPI001670E748|nr:hypothetical protein [Actinoplanes ianthinogenes]
MKRPIRQPRTWPLDPQLAVALLATELPGWDINYVPALFFPGSSPGRHVFQAARPRPGGHESVECAYPDDLIKCIDRFCEVS